MKKQSKYYAVRFGDTVEIRAALNKPREIVSRLVKETKVKTTVLQGNWPNQRYVEKEVPHRLVLEQTYYEGGKVLGIVKYSYFSSKARHYDIGLGRGMCEIPKGLRMALKDRMGA